MKLSSEQITESPEATFELAASFVRKLPPHAVVGLIGALGAGKTTFVQGMAVGLGIPPDSYITSPTFTILHSYPATHTTLYHFDLYRIGSFQALLAIGFEDFVARREGISVLEWADRFSELQSYLTHHVQIEIMDDQTRRISLS